MGVGAGGALGVAALLRELQPCRGDSRVFELIR